MKAFVLATGFDEALVPINDENAHGMFPVAGKPFLQHVVEQLVHGGVKDLTVVVCHLPQQVRGSLGDGERWGCSIRYASVRDPKLPFDAVRAIVRTWETPERILLADARRLPRFDLARNEPRRIVAGDVWTGWAVVDSSALAGLASGATWSDLRAAVPETEEAASHTLDISSWNGFLEANRAALTQFFEPLWIAAREVEPKVWLGRNVVLHPTATVNAPAYLGDDTVVEAGVVVGPNATVGSGCLLQKGSRVCDSIVFDQTHVGEGLSVDGAVVDRSRLVNIALEAALLVPDEFVLGDMERHSLGSVPARLLERLVALLFVVAVSPVLGLAALLLRLGRPGPVIHRHEVVRLPTSPSSANWKTFPVYSFGVATAQRGVPRILRSLRLNMLPTLWNIARGDMHFVGVRPRSAPAIDALDESWRALYLRSRPGLATLARARHGHKPTRDETHASETYYAIHRHWRTDLGIWMRCLLGFRKTR